MNILKILFYLYLTSDVRPNTRTSF